MAGLKNALSTQSLGILTGITLLYWNENIVRVTPITIHYWIELNWIVWTDGCRNWTGKTNVTKQRKSCTFEGMKQ